LTDLPHDDPIPAGLRARFRTAGEGIVWRVAPVPPRRAKTHRARIARLGDEEARVEEWGSASDGGVLVESGPLGALALLLVIDPRDDAPRLGARRAGRDAEFPGGAICAAWGKVEVPADEHPRLRDLVDLARYALP
jgi:hypothetical protein